MKAFHRKSAPQVVGGRVRRKNNWTETGSYYNAAPRFPLVDRKRPGPGYRHFLSQRDVHDFVALLPDWREIARGLNAIVLAPGAWNTGGYHVPGVVHVCAWEWDRWMEPSDTFYAAQRSLFERLGVPCERGANGGVVCKFTPETIRAYQLLHILLHELGHHHDRMTTRSQRDSSRGEPYAEAYALRYEALIWQRYQETFAL